MTFVVGEDCIKCKHTDCVEVCPVDCFYEGPNFLVIHPDECIDCALCEPECPIDAIFSEDELPADQENFLELNAELAEIWPNITEKKDAPADAADWEESPANLHSWSAKSLDQQFLFREPITQRGALEPSQCVDLYLPHPLSGEANLLSYSLKVEARSPSDRIA